MFLTSFLSFSAEDSNFSRLESQLRAMRAAYESRISDLEAQVKDLRSGAVQTTKATNQAVDDALAKKSPAEKAIDGSTTAPRPAIAAAGSRVTVGGYIDLGGKGGISL